MSFAKLGAYCFLVLVLKVALADEGRFEQGWVKDLKEKNTKGCELTLGLQREVYRWRLEIGGRGRFGGFCYGLGRLKEKICGGRWKEESGELKKSKSTEK